ncbi:MAG: aldo/keto reductase [Pseudomonadota bacterium]
MKDMKRRSFLQALSVLAVGSQALVTTRNVQAAVDEATRSVKNFPKMEYRKLGRTGFNGSRLIFGCGAALSKGQSTDLLEPALEAGINVFDVGFRDYYADAEMHLAPFLRKHRDEIFLISKAYVPVDIDWDEEITPAQAKAGAKGWTKFLDDSLKEMKVEHVDAYYQMAANNISVVTSDEMYEAFTKAKDAGKVSYWGISTHENAEGVLLAAAETGRFDLAQIAITPAGWYEWKNKSIRDDGKSMTDLADVLAKAREAGIGLIGMKAGRYLAGRRFLGWSRPDAFNEHYNQKQLAADLTGFQRSYAYVLANGMDAVNADMQVWQHFRENVVAATEAQKLFVA